MISENPEKDKKYFNYICLFLIIMDCTLTTHLNQILFLFLSAQFFAHSHKDDFRLQTSNNQQDNTKSFVLLAPAISPVYNNNPAFRLMSLDIEQLSLVDYSQYYMDLVMATGETEPLQYCAKIMQTKFRLLSAKMCKLSPKVRLFSQNCCLYFGDVPVSWT